MIGVNLDKDDLKDIQIEDLRQTLKRLLELVDRKAKLMELTPDEASIVSRSNIILKGW